MPESAFAKYERKIHPYRYVGQLHVGCIAAGTPTNPKVIEGYLRAKMASKDEILAAQVLETMMDLGVDEATAIEKVSKHKALNRFKRDERGLYVEGRCLKAAIKEAAMVAVAAGNLPSRSWGATNKGCKAFVAEHIFVLEERLHLGVVEPSDVIQRFVHTYQGNGIQYEEVVMDAKIDFTVGSDYEFSEEQWAALWLTGQYQGLGASRSQGYGTYTVTRWDRVE